MSAVKVDARRVAASVEDPELPFVTIEELGILRDVATDADGRVTVTVTPTYSGCPATEVIRDSIVAALAAAGFHEVEVDTVFSPAWTTDDITSEGRRKLEEGGIAPPRDLAAVAGQPILCPRCRADSARTVSEYGSTACKALMVCESCGEPFDHFKEI
ncbi:MAG TPA: 1,2-phenylacetyl-CoA epoxidase subunit PaaD [Acidimicrobiia bacterium]|nr:1,2-phenylacetyl-CoA epoxidase subunit PaaD [Acidimicrobiia bacterium]